METTFDGVLLIDKPSGCTSHDVVDFIRRRFKFRKVGHCGTLDPMATGLLMMVIGKATKVQDLLMAEDKEYQGTLMLGSTTDSQDAQGATLTKQDVPPFTETEIEAAFVQFQGDFYQIPPMVSALKKDGVPLYKLAREGKVVERAPRLVHVFYHKLLEITLPSIRFEIKCSKGFYVRTYCHDIGAKLGCGGHLSQLSRTRSGNFMLKEAISWKDLQQKQHAGDLAQNILSLADVSRIRRQ
jgi:tRNA pseudouridine55 synthase